MLPNGTSQGTIARSVKFSVGSAAWLAARPAEQERTGAGLLAVLREVAVEVMACDSYLNEVLLKPSPAASFAASMQLYMATHGNTTSCAGSLISLHSF